MMDTQDNPERYFQIYESRKITLLGFQYTIVGYAYLLHNLINDGCNGMYNQIYARRVDPFTRSLGSWKILGANIREWANFPWIFQKKDSPISILL